MATPAFELDATPQVGSTRIARARTVLVFSLSWALYVACDRPSFQIAATRAHDRAKRSEIGSAGTLMMNTFYEHHKDSIRWHYRCFDRILLNGLIQPFPGA
jgi:hypothetical protein